jgi:hypothetical protein
MGAVEWDSELRGAAIPSDDVADDEVGVASASGGRSISTMLRHLGQATICPTADSSCTRKRLRQVVHAMVKDIVVWNLRRALTLLGGTKHHGERPLSSFRPLARC